ncbi:LysR family transcriptional regulator [Ferrovibrio sp.]|uniref:LysR family transcriptional regulator n=1 Tax=Ferrovibrio sp. TaxID=1917215 RepID=UPI0025BC5215|nr:LysR family transcriptional regulator [Ferrovibrio sp.]MBX3453763.1 LysR family transcriptional regulator [Ferrovibrio sp.]
MNLRQMELFHAIMRTGSITAAARLLNVTQPAVSAGLKHCETQLKMKLFERVSGRLQPTPEAEALFPEIEGIFAKVEAVGHLTKDLQGGRLGNLSIAAGFPMANSFVAQALSGFLVQRPRLRVTVQALTSQQVINQVVNREAELGIIYEPVVSEAIETEKLAQARLACIMRPDHPLARLREIRIRDLAGQPLITYLPQAMLRAHVDHAFSRAGFVPDIVAQVDRSITGAMMARYGAGIALVEPFLVSALETPHLVARPLRPAIEIGVLLIRNRAAPRSRIGDAFVAHLKTLLRQRGTHK